MVTSKSRILRIPSHKAPQLTEDGARLGTGASVARSAEGVSRQGVESATIPLPNTGVWSVRATRLKLRSVTSNTVQVSGYVDISMEK